MKKINKNRELELYLDESGNFKNSNKYMIIGGLLFNSSNREEIDKYFVPLHRNICDALSIDEFHGCKNKELCKYLFASIGANKSVTPVLIAINKTNNDSINREENNVKKYELAIECLLKRLKMDNFIKKDDSISIYIDRINLSIEESEKIENRISRHIKCNVNIKELDSKESIYIQYSDIIVNKFSKDRKITNRDRDIVLLHPWVTTYNLKELFDYIEIDQRINKSS